MRIDRWALLPALTLILVACSARPLWSATIEVESDEDEATATPTALSAVVSPEPQRKVPTSTPIPPALSMTPTLMPTPKAAEPVPTAIPTQAAHKAAEKTAPAASKERVRVGDKVNFFNFVQAGYMALDPAQIHGIGVVVKTDLTENFTLAQKMAIEVDGARYPVKKGDLFIVYRCEKTLEEPHSGLLGYQVENLALVEVVESQKVRHLVEVKKSFKPFQPGDRVIPYESEVRRWKQAQIKKPLPGHPVQGYVVGLDNPRTQYMATDPVLITAGNKKGVVEGQRFDLYKIRSGEFDKEDLGVPAGSARVLYSGPDYSIAVLLGNCSEPIQTGFQAVYRP